MVESTLRVQWETLLQLVIVVLGVQPALELFKFLSVVLGEKIFQL